MVCISELRGLQNFQAKHPETVVIALNVLEDKHAEDAIDRLIKLGRTPIYIDVTSKGMDRTLDRLPKALHRRLRLNRSYRKFGEVELPEV